MTSVLKTEAGSFPTARATDKPVRQAGVVTVAEVRNMILVENAHRIGLFGCHDDIMKDFSAFVKRGGAPGRRREKSCSIF